MESREAPLLDIPGSQRLARHCKHPKMTTVSELEEMIQQLRQQLQESESERMKAAQYGLELLKNEAELDNKLTETTNEFATVRELLEQEKYSLQREVELKNRLMDSLNSDIESIKQQQKAQLSQQLEQQERVHGREINELKSKLEKQKSELDEAQLCEKQLRHKLDHQSELLNAKSEELRNLSERAQETMSSEVMSLQVENMELEATKGKLQEDLNEMMYHQEQLELTNNNLQRQVERLQEEKEEQEKETVSYCNALEVQIATMLQIKGLQSDPGQLERLQSMLAQKNNEIQALVVKLRRLEKMEMNYDAGDYHNGVDVSDYGDGQYYVELLKLQIDNAKKENKTVNDELSLQRMKALAESQRVLEVERKFYANERQLKQYQSENMKLRIKLDELRLKYEPEEVKERPQNHKKEKIPFEVFEEAQLTSSKTPVEATLAANTAADTRSGQTEVLHNEMLAPSSEPVIQVVPASAIDKQITELEPASKQPPSKEGKRVRILQEASDVQVLSERSNNEISRPSPSPRVSRADLKLEKPDEEEVDEEAKELKPKNKRPKLHPVIHVSSQPTVESQCSQQ
ncbi:hypothetical protein scyTo_0001800 [Scyliorhinus torazame]|uniref:Protein Spindly n=1 Tax=Scyliorhinus torazame TaxID=75743 RepID=A0A401PG04_SCYTO|nr:hypothetical protein [Scyliorhinus torazame]